MTDRQATLRKIDNQIDILTRRLQNLQNIARRERARKKRVQRLYSLVFLQEKDLTDYESFLLENPSLYGQILETQTRNVSRDATGVNRASSEQYRQDLFRENLAVLQETIQRVRQDILTHKIMRKEIQTTLK